MAEKKSTFPNYQEVQLDAGTTVKVAPLKLDNPDNVTLLLEVAESIEVTGSLFIFMRRVPMVLEALKRSLAENHTEDEVAKAIGSLRMSLDKGSPYMNCIFALMGRSIAPDKANDE